MSEIPPCLPDSVAGPDVIYSSQPGPVVQIDGACFSRPTLMESIQNEDDILIVSNGTNLIDCAVVECGRVGLYCYEAVDSPITAILALQPLHFPAPVISLAANQARCYHNPALVHEVLENYGTVLGPTGKTSYGSYALPVELAACGVSYLYEACNGNEQIVVVDESSPTVYYDGQCWTNPQVVIEYGTGVQTVAGTDVTPVSGCTDILCTGSDASGAVIGYVDHQLSSTINVRFEHLDIGIPYYGVAPEKIDDGESGLTPGQATVSLDGSKARQIVIPSVPADGRLLFTVAVDGVQKRLVLTRSGVDTSYNLQSGTARISLDVLAGDRIQIEVKSSKPNRAHVGRKVTGYITWKSSPLPVRKYDQAVLNYVGTTAINAVSFCGLAARTPYVFFDSLPAVEENTYPNPDTFLTVQGTYGPEYVLVTSQSYGDRVPGGPDGSEPYAGQGVVGPLTFRFYTGRGAAGAHGEMDVWLDAPGQFPEALAAGRYRLLERPDSWYRRSEQAGDTSRSALTVAQPGQVYTLPGVYASDSGATVVVEGRPQDTYEGGGTFYTLTGTAYGLAFNVI